MEVLGVFVRRRGKIFLSVVVAAFATTTDIISTTPDINIRAENSKAPRVRGAFEFSARQTHCQPPQNSTLERREQVSPKWKPARAFLLFKFRGLSSCKIRRRLLHEAPSNFQQLVESLKIRLRKARAGFDEMETCSRLPFIQIQGG